MSGPLSPGDVVNERYQIQGYVGAGGMQFVYSAKDLILERTVALKTPKNSSAEKRFHRSAIVSAKVNHPNVAKTLDYFELDDRPFLAEEFVDGQDLDKALLKQSGHLDPYLVARIFHYLAKGLAASHHAEVIHRDLKPTNIMVSGGFQLSTIKITDFGIAKMADEELAEAAEGGDETITNSQTAVGALPYMAPEAIETPRKVGTAADIWSIGAMIFELLTGKKPFGTGYQAVAKIVSGTSPEFPGFLTANPQFFALSEQLKSIVLTCMQKDPSARPTADQLVALCGNLCYPIAKRLIGTIRIIHHNAWGFINLEGTDVFFNFQSVYGDRPKEGDRVMLSLYPGGGAYRAHPVIKL